MRDPDQEVEHRGSGGTSERRFRSHAPQRLRDRHRVSSPALRSAATRRGIRQLDVDVVCPECGDATTWLVAYNPRELPERIRQLERETTMTCSHWRTVHELVWEQAISRRHERPR
jgi:hypothetical protein